ncbi:bifunctional adenosylcobinamide kinase/adenosylcobinamide-phosphate guanylyltransferase [Candidatus Magnetominusculus dajiuhuensis]|uniref:bifunctional adenosylcobinamide kinase/adenosylcobinamide-phosphate guanylyltransferase n=1 Tax=Candidatus Magnetominusculus dajiuhuensis TaxID=3137712 RepID=UPI003B429FEA
MKIIFITGGSRSGKSSYALKLSGQQAGKKAFIATAEPLDDEMRLRIDAHKRQRSDVWETFEEPVRLSEMISELVESYDVILVDCLTLWLSNCLMREPFPEIGTVTKEIDDFISRLKKLKATESKDKRLYLVSNEVGMSIVPDNKLARVFRDAAGLLNQQAAAVADEVYFVVSGLPLKLK